MHCNTVWNGLCLEIGCYAVGWYEGQPVTTDLCGHIDHGAYLTGDGEGDDELDITRQMMNMIVIKNLIGPVNKYQPSLQCIQISTFVLFLSQTRVLSVKNNTF